MSPLPAQRFSLRLAAVLLTGLFGILAVRLHRVQIASQPEVTERVERLLAAKDSRPARRGDIRLRDGTILAREVDGYTLAIDPSILPPPSQRAAIEVACATLGLPGELRQRKLARLAENHAAAETADARPLRYLPVARRIGPERARELKAALAERFGGAVPRGVILKTTPARRYPRRTMLGQVVGWTGMGATADDIAGAAGIERALDAYLTGVGGHRISLKDCSQRNRFLWSDDIDIPPVDGHDVVLTIDGRIQKIIEEELEIGVGAARAEAGLVVVLECSSGDVLGLANYPAIDPGMAHVYPDEERARRRRNRVIESVYEPGSTIKPFWAAGALEAGLFRLDDVIWTGGGVATLLGRRVTDVRDHGPLTFQDAVVHSSNIGMAIVGLRLGKKRLNDILDRFHFQERTGILLPGEEDGKRTPLERWTEKYTTISVAFGFELGVTPIQLAAAFASLVNGGRYFPPRIVESLRRGGEVHQFPTGELGRPIRADTSRAMREVLRQVVVEGTGRRWDIPELPFGGKTGTAAISKGPAGYAAGGKEYLSSFLAYAPHPDPELVVLVTIERPKTAHYGSTVCGPVVQAILRRIYRIREGEPGT